MRLHAVAAETGYAFRWRPFSVRAIMIEQKNIPFVGKPVKLAYMWRDIERRARARRASSACRARPSARGIRPCQPGRDHRRKRGLVRRLHRARRLSALVPSQPRAGCSEPGLSDALRRSRQSPARVVEAAKSEEIGERYKAATEEAKSIGVSARRSASPPSCSGRRPPSIDAISLALRISRRPQLDI